MGERPRCQSVWYQKGWMSLPCHLMSSLCPSVSRVLASPTCQVCVWLGACAACLYPLSYGHISPSSHWTCLQVEPLVGLVVSECRSVAARMAGVPLVSSCAVGLLCNSHEMMARCLRTSGALIRRLIVEAGSKRSLVMPLHFAFGQSRGD